MKRIAMILTNPCTHDSRVIKEAESLAQAGYEITVFCLWKPGLPHEEMRAGVRYIRIPLARNYIATIRTMRTRIRNTVRRHKKRAGRCMRHIRTYLHTLLRAIRHTFRITLKAITTIMKLPFIPLHIFLKHAAAPSPSNDTCIPAAPTPGTTRAIIRSLIIDGLKYRITRHTFLPALLAYKPDIVHAHDLITLPTGVAAARKCGAKLVFDSHELEEHRDPPLPRWQRYWIRHLLNRYIPRADAMIVVSEGIAGYTRQHHPGHPPLHIIFNAPSPAKGSPPAQPIRDQIGLPPGDTLIIYIGGVGLNRGVDLIVRAIALDPSMHLAILGPRHPRFDTLLMQVVHKTGATSRIHFPPIVGNDDVIHSAADADAGIHIPRNTCLNHYYSMPNKLFEMLFARIPIVGPSDSHDIATFIGRHGVGVTVNQHDPQDVLDGIRRAISLKAQLRQDAGKYALLETTYAWEAQEYTLLSLYADLYRTTPKP